VGNLRLTGERRLVDLIFTSSNPLISWLKALATLRPAA
jgi:hypothetical protein